MQRLAQANENTPPLATFAGLAPEQLRDEAQRTRGAETPIPRFYEVVVTHGRRPRRRPANPMGDRVAPRASTMPVPIAPGPGVLAASASLPRTGNIALGTYLEALSLGELALKQALTAPFIPCSADASPINTAQNRFKPRLAIPQVTAPLAPSRIRVAISAPPFDAPEARQPNARVAASVTIALPVTPVLTPAEFSASEPVAPTGSSTPVRAVVNFPICPVWLPALFSMTNRLAKLQMSSWLPAPDWAPIVTAPCLAGADGPSFSGSLAWPAPRALFRDFQIQSTNSTLEAKPLTASPPTKHTAAPGRVWRSFPAFAGGFALVAALLLPVIFASKLQSGFSSPDFSSLKAAAQARATVNLQEDFRSGLTNWTGLKGWASTWQLDSFGMVRPGHLALWQPSLSLSDYRFEFVSQIDSKGVGFVLRAADMNNYQAVKFVTVKPGATPMLALVRYAVVNGREEAKTQMPLPLEARRDTVYRTIATVDGDHFSVLVNGQLAGGWTDTRLKSGGVGFFAEKGESARLVSVHVVDHDDFLGWLCSQVSPWTADRRVSGVTE